MAEADGFGVDADEFLFGECVGEVGELFFGGDAGVVGVGVGVCGCGGGLVVAGVVEEDGLEEGLDVGVVGGGLLGVL